MVSKVELLLVVTATGLILQATKSGATVNTADSYTCVWNSPTVLCERFGFTFNLSKFEIVQNQKGLFNGENITIFYGPGEFPKIDRKTGNYTNGGLPQQGNLTLHLEKLTQDIDQLIPNKDFNGLAVLDFEQWRPLFKHNFDALDIYQKASVELVKKQHPDWTNSTQINEEAEKQFNTAGRQFFESTLMKARELRPGGRWGYYGFPRCYGNHGNYCAPGSQEDNNEINWLWSASSALFPRIYLGETENQTEKVFYLMATVHESVRLASLQRPGDLVVYPYSKHTYVHKPGEYYSFEDVWLSHVVTTLLGGDGVVVWGSTKSMESQQLCETLQVYVEEAFGPLIKIITDWARSCSETVCNSHGRCTAQDIPSELSFLGSGYFGGQEKWMAYFMRLIQKLDLPLSENYDCKCFPGWKGDACKEPTIN